MSKIFSEKMKNRTLTTSFGIFKFDAQGYTEVPEEHANKLLALKGYKFAGESLEESPVEPKNPEENDNENTKVEKSSSDENNSQIDDSKAEDNTPKEDEPKEEHESNYTEESLSGKNVPQLKKIAKDNDIDLNGANKKDEIIAIIIGAMNK